MCSRAFSLSLSLLSPSAPPLFLLSFAESRGQCVKAGLSLPSAAFKIVRRSRRPAFACQSARWPSRLQPLSLVEQTLKFKLIFLSPPSTCSAAAAAATRERSTTDTWNGECELLQEREREKRRMMYTVKYRMEQKMGGGQRKKNKLGFVKRPSAVAEGLHRDHRKP